MNGILVLTKKEFLSLFRSPVAYVVMTLFLSLSSLWFFFVNQFLAQDVASLRSYFALMPLMCIVFLPAITMRSWAEETSSGTAELLLTMPFTEVQLVIGKFLAAFALVCVVMLLSVFVPLTVLPLGRFEIGQIFGQYTGTLLLASAGLAIGQFISVFSRNQISAFLFAAVGLTILTAIHVINSVVLLPRSMASLINHLSFLYHFANFERGVIDSRAVIYFLLITVLCLYLNAKVLVFRKWS
jgi:ABC-2 type transport system permease protein